MLVRKKPGSFLENIPETNICENPRNSQREKPGFQFAVKIFFAELGRVFRQDARMFKAEEKTINRLTLILRLIYFNLIGSLNGRGRLHPAHEPDSRNPSPGDWGMKGEGEKVER